MKDLQRTQVDKFCIENAVTLENLSQRNIISIEDLCKNEYEKVDFNDRKLELFLNGVMLTITVPDGVYRVYNKNRFIGLGIVKNELIKRDIIIK